MANGSLPIIGLAGGIGAGKSTVAGILADLGCLVVDSDRLARQCLAEPEVRDQIVSWWGPAVANPDGSINRAAVAGIVFARPRERKRLESLVHPRIEARRRVLFDQAPAGTLALVIDAPLLFEAGLAEECDAVVFVETDRATRLARLEASRGWNDQKLREREESQLALDEKRRRSDYVIINGGDLPELTEQISRILSEIVQR